MTTLWLIVFGLIAVGILCLAQLRNAFVSGWRCVARYPVLWRLPALLSAAYGGFEIVSLLLLSWRTGHGWPEWSTADGPVIWDGGALFLDSLLPTGEQFASLLNCLPAPYPLSALAALAFLGNTQSTATLLRRALARKWQRKGSLLFALIVLCALAAILRPIFTLALPETARLLPWAQLLPLLTTLNALAFAFDYLFATAAQLYLLFTAWSWIRGLQFDPARLIRFVTRRLAAIMEWPLLIIAVTLLLVHGPLLLQAFASQEMTWQTDSFLRPFWALILLLLPAVQIHLSLHNQNLRKAIAANRAFLRAHWLSYLLYALFSLGLLQVVYAIGLGGQRHLADTVLGTAWMTLCQTLAGAVSGWLLAVWVCLYVSGDSKRGRMIF